MPKLPNLTQDSDGDTSWIDLDDDLGDGHGIVLIIETTGEPPTAEAVENAVRILARAVSLTGSAAELVLDNYSKEMWVELGVDEEELVDETPEAIATAMTLEIAAFDGEEFGSFELTFSLPWDDEHSYDVEFEGDEPVICAVNG